MEEKSGHRRLRRGILLPIIAFILVVAASAAAVKLILGPSIGTANTNAPASGTSSQDMSSSSQALYGTSSATSSASEASSQSSAVSTSSSKTSSAVSAANGDTSSFANAVFIGDSLTSGIRDYNIAKTDGVLAANGMTTRSALTSKVSVTSGSSLSVPDAVTSIKPVKIYLLLGANEIQGTTGTQGFVNNYGKLVDALKTADPQAKIYIQSIFPVTAAYAQSTGVTNDQINSFNQALQQLSTQKGATYLDVASVFKGSDGSMDSTYAATGYNIKKSAYTQWLNYLAAHE